MADFEAQIELLERQFPAVSGAAFAAARAQVLASGQSVLESEEGIIFEVFPDGSRKMVKKIEPPAKAVMGEKFLIE